MTDFLTYDHPLFAPGSVWVACDGYGHETTIRRVEPWPGGNAGKWGYEVYHGHPSGDREYNKDIWHFQIRYKPKLGI